MTDLPAVVCFRQRRELPLLVALIVFASALIVFASAAFANTLEEASQSQRSGQHAKALTQVNKFLAGNPQDPQGRLLKGVILNSLNKPAEAIALFRKLTEDYPRLPEPYNNLAVIYAQQKQYDKAKESLEMAIRTHPAYATAHANLGDIYSSLASQAYGKALQLDAGKTQSTQIQLAMIDGLANSNAPSASPTPSRPASVSAQPDVASVPTPVPVIVPPRAPTPVMQPEAKLPAVAIPVAAKSPEAEPMIEVAKLPDPKPAAPAKESAKKPADDRKEITAAIDNWLSAWSKKDVKVYLSYYARDFEPPQGQSRKAWEADRKQRVAKPGKIEVRRDKLTIALDSADKATARFRQDYSSVGFNASSNKTLVLVKRDGKWLIQEERVGG